MNRCNLRTVKRLNTIIQSKKYKQTNRIECRAWIAKIDYRWVVGGQPLPHKLRK